MGKRITNRRDFLINAYRIGGIAALMSLGLYPKDIQAFGVALGSSKKKSAEGTALLSEQFGAQGDWTPTTGGNGTYNFNNTTYPLSGAADLLLSIPSSGGNVNVESPAFTASSDVYVAFMFIQSSVAGSGNVLTLHDASDNQLGGITFGGSGLIRALSSTAAAANDGWQYASTTTLYLKMRYTASGNVTVWSSATGASSSWTECGSISSGASASATYIKFNIVEWDYSAQFDNVKVDTSDINY